ncbi:Oidioi.mRNA.OKI2018_I69.chr2.g5962.t1.cds [Oikopleura dioica]|uniref:Oidioi.mRNA.OKI2018_I69.chr2.g5962.t1.cds n=1 Tax=Oikopleura dioica TaxID=34765 RepID=A0ABN7T696_OIKDI|nr:Oidioi.mRNA.OKI2018_I69.chr2.g5962.t1.cds [Oikopleura dioica]
MRLLYLFISAVLSLYDFRDLYELNDVRIRLMNTLDTNTPDHNIQLREYMPYKMLWKNDYFRKSAASVPIER